MSANQSRLDLLIDVFELRNQHAKALAALTPPELVAAVLEEFGELEFLGDSPADYQLIKASDGSPLDDSAPLDRQLADKDRLVLVEREAPLPPGATRPTRHIYLRDQASGKVYKLHWQPAIIGRPDKGQEHNEWVAVNLGLHEAGPRVSRRHAQITEIDGRYFVERLSQNPTAVKDGQGTTTPIEQKKHPLHHGDVIYLEYSQIALKFIVREKEPAT